MLSETRKADRAKMLKEIQILASDLNIICALECNNTHNNTFIVNLIAPSGLSADFFIEDGNPEPNFFNVSWHWVKGQKLREDFPLDQRFEKWGISYFVGFDNLRDGLYEGFARAANGSAYEATTNSPSQEDIDKHIKNLQEQIVRLADSYANSSNAFAAYNN